MILHITQLLPLIYATQPPRNPTLRILGVTRLTHITYYTILSLYSNIEQPWMYSFLGTQLGVFHIRGRILLHIGILHITFTTLLHLLFLLDLLDLLDLLHLLHSQHFCRFIAICYIFYMLRIVPSCKQTYIRCGKMHVNHFPKGFPHGFSTSMRVSSQDQAAASTARWDRGVAKCFGFGQAIQWPMGDFFC